MLLVWYRIRQCWCIFDYPNQGRSILMWTVSAFEPNLHTVQLHCLDWVFCLHAVGFYRRDLGCEIWSVILREERTLRLFENIILELILGKWDGNLRTGCIWLTIWTSGGSSEHGNEHSVSIKSREILDPLNDSSSRRTLLHGVSYKIH
jgi:hypothetical protein